VELSEPGIVQGKALQLLLKLIQSDCQLYSEFMNYEYYKLLRKVFMSRRCKADVHLLQVSCLYGFVDAFKVIQISTL